MVTPSAPTLHAIPFSYARPMMCPPDEAKLLNEGEKHIICDATDQLLKEIGCLRKVDLDFANGTVSFTAEYIDGHTRQLDREEVVLDILARKFFEDNKEYIEYINPSFASRLWSNVYAKDIEKISEIFYLAYERYKEQYTKEDTLDSRVRKVTIYNLKPGFKSFNYDSSDIAANPDILQEASGEKFKNFIQTYPTSLLSGKKPEKAILFLQSGVDQKSSYEEKVSYLKQVLFLLNFQELFKNILQNMHQRAIAEKRNINMNPCGGDNSPENLRHLQMRIELLSETLSQFPVNDIAMLIPLAFRSSPNDLSEHNAPFENFSQIGCEYSALECSKAKEADTAIRNVLQKKFPEDFSLERSYNNEGIRSINQYLMGISGLAISQGLMGRVAMYNHRNINYCYDSLFQMEPVKDNFLMEFLLAATQFSSNQNYDWIEEKYLGYITEMMGKISIDELNDIKSNIYKLHRVVDELPVAEYLLKKHSSSNQLCADEYVLRNSAIKKLHLLCKATREKVGLPPIRDNTSSCSIM